MNKNKQTTKNRKGRHLTYGKRCRIETLLAEGQSMRYIAECVGCSPSTVSREIKQHSFIQKSHTNDCLKLKQIELPQAQCMRWHFLQEKV